MHHDRTSHTTTRRYRNVAVAFAVFAVGLVTACGDGGGGNAGAESPEASNAAVVMQLIAFKPETVTIDAGTTVTWTQKDPGVHTVTSGSVEQGGNGVATAPDGRFESGELATGRTFRFTFDQPGIYPYFCSAHPATMRGEVRVT